ncbi:hypothetical protein EKO04_003915 [Ascochyta lentis]|uniref:Transcription factor domain-containing protein n=1 Tax=Ascochyta lentis TaxID=205686 RepID=A0A8H7MKD5_9PLEO|nr:hypothetical protein EKO04_003915 [Ascochyta lentis]
MDDYLTSVYPLIPVVHRPSFRFDLGENRDVYDNDFLGLIVAICAVVVALLPSRFESYCNFPSSSPWAQSRAELLSRCYDFLSGLRGPDFFEEIGYNKWASSYLMAIAFFQIGKHNRARMIEVECMQLGRLLDLHRIEEYRDLDCIETQLRKKGFWLLFYAYIHAEVQNFRKERLSYLDHAALESINLEALMPLEVEDEQIFEEHVITSSTSEMTLTMGFVIHSRIFWQALQDPYVNNTGCLCCRSRSPAAQVEHLQSRLRELKYALDDAPVQLRQWVLPYSLPASEAITHSQQATLRANIHVTHLWLQSMLLDQLDLLTSPEEHWHDREVISSQLLHVLHNTPQKDIEPNGLHLVYKVRDVAVGLLACPFSIPNPSAKRAQEYVREFTDIMARLDASETVNTANIQSWIDTGRRVL